MAHECSEISKKRWNRSLSWQGDLQQNEWSRTGKDQTRLGLVFSRRSAERPDGRRRKRPALIGAMRETGWPDKQSDGCGQTNSRKVSHAESVRIKGEPYVDDW